MPRVTQSLAALQPRQVLVEVAQMGVAPEQLVLARHCTHLLVAVLHTAVVPPHWALFAAVHWTQAPLAAHAERAGSLRAPHSLSPAQAWHLLLLPHRGVAPLQLAAEVHWTQVFVAVSHTGVAPLQDALDVH
jgi:hypothetical protein